MTVADRASLVEGVLASLSQAEAYPLVGLEGTIDAVSSALAQHAGSLLLVGPRGPAKAAAVAAALAAVPPARGGRAVVRLHGATRDTPAAVAHVCAALSLPPGAVATCGQLAAALASGRLPAHLEAAGEIWPARPAQLVVVVDAFEHFAAGLPQLLYTLLDQCYAGSDVLDEDAAGDEGASVRPAAGASAAVSTVFLALSSRGDVLDALEKRVRSRMAQAVCYVPHPPSCAEYAAVLCAALAGGPRGESEWARVCAAALADERCAALLRARWDASRDPQAAFPALADALVAWAAAAPDGHASLSESGRPGRGGGPRGRRAPPAHDDADVFAGAGPRHAPCAASRALAECVAAALASAPAPDAAPALTAAEVCVLVALRRIALRRSLDAACGARSLVDASVSLAEVAAECACGIAQGVRQSDAEMLAGRFGRAAVRVALSSLAASGMVVLEGPAGSAHHGRIVCGGGDAQLSVRPALPPAAVLDVASECASLSGVHAALHRVCLERVA